MIHTQCISLNLPYKPIFIDEIPGLPLRKHHFCWFTYLLWWSTQHFWCFTHHSSRRASLVFDRPLRSGGLALATPRHGGFSIVMVCHGGTQNALFIRGNPNVKWMMAGGSPMTKRKPPNHHRFNNKWSSDWMIWGYSLQIYSTPMTWETSIFAGWRSRLKYGLEYD